LAVRSRGLRRRGRSTKLKHQMSGTKASEIVLTKKKKIEGKRLLVVGSPRHLSKGRSLNIKNVSPASVKPRGKFPDLGDPLGRESRESVGGKEKGVKKRVLLEDWTRDNDHRGDQSVRGI